MDWSEQEKRFGAINVARVNDDQQRIQQSLQNLAQKKPKKNFWTDQISTALGIAGGIGGSFIAPIAGTAGGAAAGSALGESIENFITGNKVTDNVVKEGVIGGVLGAGPLKLAKGAVGGVKALKAGESVVQGARQSALTPLRQKAGQRLTGTADDLAVKQFRLTPTQLKNFNQKFKEDAGTTIRKYGFQTADDISVKGIEPLQAKFDDAIGGITGVSKESLKKALSKRITSLSKAGPSDTQAIGGSLKKEANQLLKGFGDVIDANELNQIRRQFDSLVNYGEKVANPARYGVNKRMADALRETLQKSDSTGNLKNLGRELQKLRQLNDNALRQGQLGRGSLPFGLGLTPGAVLGSTGGPAGAVVGIAGQAITNSPAGRRITMKTVEKIGNKLTKSGDKTVGQSSKGIATRVGLVGALNGLGNQVPDQSLENNPITANVISDNTNIPMSSNIPQPYTTDPTLSTPNDPFSQDVVQSNIEQILAQGGSMKDAKEYIDLVASLKKLYPDGGSEKPLSAEASKVIANANSGLEALSQFENIISQDPNSLRKTSIPGRGLANGLGNSILGLSELEANKQFIIDAWARIKTGAAISQNEEARFNKNLPQAFDTPEAVQVKLNNIRNLFNGVVNRTGSGGTDLESAVLQYSQ